MGKGKHKTTFKKSVCVSVHVCTCVHVSTHPYHTRRFPWRPEERVGCLGTEFSDSGEPSNMGGGIQTLVLSVENTVLLITETALKHCSAKSGNAGDLR